MIKSAVNDRGDFSYEWIPNSNTEEDEFGILTIDQITFYIIDMKLFIHDRYLVFSEKLYDLLTLAMLGGKMILSAPNAFETEKIGKKYSKNLHILFSTPHQKPSLSLTI